MYRFTMFSLLFLCALRLNGLSMKIIADCGSSKCDWALIDDQSIDYICSVGFNPVTISSEQISDIISKVYSENAAWHQSVSGIYFYGAGCLPGSASKKVESALGEIFGNKVKISVKDDLTAAAYALFGNGDGIVCILGTGSNSGLYSSGSLVDKIPSLGFILGDEGSGSYMGRVLINKIYKQDLSPEIKKLFEFEFGTSQKDILSKVYSFNSTSAYLASFIPFLKRHLDIPEIENIVRQTFECFFQSNIIKYKNYENYEIGFVGGVAFAFSDLLRDVASNYGLKISEILCRPLDDLIEYHR